MTSADSKGGSMIIAGGISADTVTWVHARDEYLRGQSRRLYSALPIVSIRKDHPWNRTENNCIKKILLF